MLARTPRFAGRSVRVVAGLVPVVRSHPRAAASRRVTHFAL